MPVALSQNMEIQEWGYRKMSLARMELQHQLFHYNILKSQELQRLHARIDESVQEA